MTPTVSPTADVDSVRTVPATGSSAADDGGAAGWRRGSRAEVCTGLLLCGTARKGKETQGKTVITAFRRRFRRSQEWSE
eukprot:SAG22_NODE_16801_length_317_cov_0.940367_1_plen_78_part_01